MQILADRDAERTKQHPGHETEVEVEERREQGRQMAGLEETLMHDEVTLIRRIAVDPPVLMRERSAPLRVLDPIVVERAHGALPGSTPVSPCSKKDSRWIDHILGD